MVDYAKRLVEVDEVLSYLSEENLNKIPEDVRNLIKENKDKDYTWKFDETKELKDQDLSRDTIIILSYLNMEYLLNEEQKKLMEKIHEFNERKQEKEKQEKYNEDNIFNNKKENFEIQQQKQEQEQVENKSLVEYKDSVFKRIINKIKSFFGY